MRFRIGHAIEISTNFVQLNTRACGACWKCVEKCQKDVVAKVDFLGHQHALIVEPAKCTGCLKCVRACQYGAFKQILNSKEDLS